MMVGSVARVGDVFRTNHTSEATQILQSRESFFSSGRHARQLRNLCLIVGPKCPTFGRVPLQPASTPRLVEARFKMQSRSPLTRPQPSTQSFGAVNVRLVVLVPAYNPGGILIETVRALLAFHPDVWLLVDGSTDGSDLGIESKFRAHRGFRVLRRSRNLGKGATLLEGEKNADLQNFTHILTFDSDGQHPPEHVPEFRGLCQRFPEALIMGQPRFGSDAPFERVFFRWIANALVLLETFGRIRCDSLFGMRAYPIRSFLAAFAESAGGLRYDFDTEIAVRLGWAGLNVIGVGVPVCYPHREAGGVSHYRYVHDNLVLAWAHGRLLCDALVRFLRGRLPKGTAGIEQRISGAGS